MKKWLFRLLVLIAVVIAFTLFALQVLSGTSDTHKRGLEQAFSEIFKGDAQFGTLKAFNLFPQFTVEIEKLQIAGINNLGNLTADHFLIVFGSIDLVTKNRQIENFQIKNLYVSEGVFTPLSLQLDELGLQPTDKPDAGKLNFKGKYGTHDLSGEFATGVKPGARPKYFFNDQNLFAMNVGFAQLSGVFNPYASGGAKMSDLKIFAQKTNGHLECKIYEGKDIDFSAFVKDVVGKASEAKAPQDITKLCESLK